MKPNLLHGAPRIITFFLAECLMACNSQTSKEATMNDMADPPAQQVVFDKLIGTWKSEDGKSFERWTKNGNGEYSCAGFSLKNGDTSWNEHATIYKENDNWIFKNTVKGQNEGKSIKFTSSQLTGNTIQFSNPDHDFPTDVNYTLVDDNTVKAFIVGPNNKDGKDTIPFNFTRVK